MHGAPTTSNSKGNLRATYAAMSDDEILRLASEGGLTPDAKDALSEELRMRNISWAAISAERERQNQAKLQVLVGRNPYWKFKGTGLRFRGEKFRSREDEEQGISVRTRWVMLWWMSLVPLGSYRVKAGTGNAWEYRVMSREPLEWRQVIVGWMQTAAVLLLVMCVTFLARWVAEQR